MTGLNGWTRTVEVGYVNPNNLITQIGANTGIKIIVVVVLHNERQVAKLYSIRTGAAQSMADRFGEIRVVVK